MTVYVCCQVALIRHSEKRQKKPREAHSDTDQREEREAHWPKGGTPTKKGVVGRSDGGYTEAAAERVLAVHEDVGRRHIARAGPHQHRQRQDEDHREVLGRYIAWVPLASARSLA